MQEVIQTLEKDKYDKLNVEQDSINGPWVKFGFWSVFANKVLLEHSYTTFFFYMLSTL